MFTSYEFTEEETVIAANLPDLNYKFIQNELAAAAMERAVTKYDPLAPEAFKLQQEFNRGKIEILSYLLTCSDNAKDEAIAQLTRAAEAQHNEE